MRTRLSIQALEAFEAVSRTGALQDAARELGLSVSSVWHHVGRLEDELGTPLLDRSRRPLRLTAEGHNFLIRIEEGLRLIRLARREAEIGGVSASRAVRIGLIDDFEGEVGPVLAVALSRALPRAALAIRTVESLEALDLLADRQIDLAIAAAPEALPPGIVSLPLLRDPFVLAVAADRAADAPIALDDGETGLLRYSPRLLIGRQIDAQLRRAGLSLPGRYEFDDAASLLALVTENRGVAIVTPTAFARARRYANRVLLRPLPLPAFSRRIVLHARRDAPEGLAAEVAEVMRGILAEACVAPACARFPWLADLLRVEFSGSAR